MQARVARSQGWPITVLLGCRGRTDPHRHDTTHLTDRDRRMALALQVYEDACCTGCGMPHWVGDEWDRAEVRERVCHWCEDVASQVTERAKRYGETQPPGLHYYAVDTGDTAYTPEVTPGA